MDLRLYHAHEPRWWVMLSILLLVGVESAVAVPVKKPAGQKSGPVTTSKSDLTDRIAQLEALCRTAKQAEDQGQKSTQLLAQFYSAEYSAVMEQISAWASLQYAFFPILVAACAMLTQLKNVRINFRWWAAIGVLLIGYLAYQGTMLDTLQKVLFIERYLRPLASRVVGADKFWIHECIYRQTQVGNIFQWKYLPPIICFCAVAVVGTYIRIRHGFGRWDYSFAVVAIFLWAGVLGLTIGGARLEEQIVKICEARIPRPETLLLEDGRPNRTVEGMDAAQSRAPAAHQ